MIEKYSAKFVYRSNISSQGGVTETGKPCDRAGVLLFLQVVATIETTLKLQSHILTRNNNEKRLVVT